MSTTRNKPCLCASCPECGATFFATAIREDYLTDSEENRDTLKTVANYFKEGFDINVKDATAFKLDYCEHLKQYKGG
jgi:hypothetical protein